MTRSRLMTTVVASVALALPAAMLTATVGAHAAVGGGRCAPTASAATIKRVDHIAIATVNQGGGGCAVGATTLTSNEPPYISGSIPPLVHHTGGKVMATGTSSLVITPIYWVPTGSSYSFDTSYKNLIQQYLTDVGHDSGKRTNIYSTLTQYSGSNGRTHYNIAAGTAITDTSALPTSTSPSVKCTFNTGSIYADGTGYSACLTDTQLRAEVAHVLSTHSLSSDLTHIYALFLPKGVESCFYPDNVPTGRQQACTINSTPSAAYCAYHSAAGSTNNSIYASMPFPIYQSATGRSCAVGGSSAPQSPNNQTDADVVLSTLSHEVSESMSDPHLDSWYAVDGNENGDLCSYIYGNVSGTAGHFYNQTINGHHYLTQEEFSNKEFVPGVAGCEQNEKVPTLTSLSRTSGSHSGGGVPITIHGSSFRAGKTTVKFGTVKGTSVIVASPTLLTVIAPAHAAGVVNVTTVTPNGTSPITSHDKYTFT